MNLNKFTYTLVIVITSLHSIRAQNLSQQCISTLGQTMYNSNLQLDATLGQTAFKTLSASSNILTQGFQQTFRLSIQAKALLQGYYDGNSTLKNVLFNQGIHTNPSMITDSILIVLHAKHSPYNALMSKKVLLTTSGELHMEALGLIGQEVYIELQHRNSISTWSANPVTITANTIYDFTTSASQAYGDNQAEVEPGIWAIYSGDIDQDGAVTVNDFSLWEGDANNFESGYKATDLDGDGGVATNDFTIWEANSNNFVGSITP